MLHVAKSGYDQKQGMHIPYASQNNSRSGILLNLTENALDNLDFIQNKQAKWNL